MAFSADALLSNAGVGSVSPSVTPEMIGRAVQLGYPQGCTAEIAKSLADHATARQVSFIRLRDLLAALQPKSRSEDGDDDLDEWETIPDDDQVEEGRASSVEQQTERFLASSLLMDGLEQAAAGGNAGAHFAIAALNRCKKPNVYLYEESLKGRILNTVEQGWVDAFVKNKPRFEKYEHHLRQAAIGGVRHAAAEFAEVFDDAKFYALAERGKGAIDAWQMVKVADSLNDGESSRRWLRIAAEEGSLEAIESLARSGDVWALRKQAEAGDVHAIRELAEMAMETDLGEAWMWLYVAQMLGTDLTKSTMRAYHDGGQQHGQEYDDDFGGALYVDGDEGMELMPLDPGQDLKARELAHLFFNKIPNVAPYQGALDLVPRGNGVPSEGFSGRAVARVEVRKPKHTGGNGH
ncbi:hypothetical protein LP417_35535 (plasmid) [Polaromonas sp. P1-6]|nr:hypothetical protein LP417_35535 [Polaromonas sp. P1-6]